MTKADELFILQTAIDKLGPDSYLGPWLQQVRDEVEAMVKADLFPTEISISRTHQQCMSRVETAHAHCKQIGEDARKEADRIVQEARERGRASLAYARRCLEEAIGRIS